eukprot:TRINITY_DN972_c0_g1_i2.p1 TRINITY_DN972_c0_g1~~TRINITY_DN972_c0_g1_i2.p1  ORF type:complete len:153 (-),score=21.28 TRINITY_DN972_c0_g1_i2:61-519(-)
MEGNNTSFITSFKNFVTHENFTRFFRFGALDQNILLLGLLTGVGLDHFIHRKFGVAGYGPIIGAGISNWVADFTAALPEGRHASLGITAGTVLPLCPLIAYMLAKRPFDSKNPPKLLVGLATVSIIGIFANQFYRPDKDDIEMESEKDKEIF